jgi:hypothetical protein
MNPTDREDLESILHRLIVDIAKDKEVMYRMMSKQSFADLVHMMKHLFQYQPKKDQYVLELPNRQHEIREWRGRLALYP